MSRNCKIMAGFFLIRKKTSDTIEHHILLRKVEKTGTRGKPLRWLKSYIQERFERRVVNGMTSSWSKISWIPARIYIETAAFSHLYN